MVRAVCRHRASGLEITATSGTAASRSAARSAWLAPDLVEVDPGGPPGQDPRDVRGAAAVPDEEDCGHAWSLGTCEQRGGVANGPDAPQDLSRELGAGGEVYPNAIPSDNSNLSARWIPWPHTTLTNRRNSLET